MTVGNSTSGKPINLSQLEQELAQVAVPTQGLGMAEQYIFTYDASGQPADFAEAASGAVDQAIAAHLAMRDKTDAEYATEFQDANTSPARKQEIRDITGGLLPREQVPITQEEWDTRYG